MKNTWSLRSVLIWLSIGLFAYGVFVNNKNQKSEYVDLRFSEFVKDVETHQVKSVNMSNNSTEVIALYNNNTKGIVRFPEYDRDFVMRLLEHRVEINVTAPDEFGSMFWINLLTAWLPNILLFGLILYANIGGRSGNGFSFGKSRAKKLGEKDKIITFDDVAGLPEAKDELLEIVDFLKNPEKFVKVGAKIPKGVLLYGPPGTGKTLLARAIAGEAKVPFLYMSGADFVEVFVGVGASRVRDVFAQARKLGKCIIFIDELDSIGKRRNSYTGSNEERENTLNQLLVELDGFDPNTGTIVIGATNRSEILDPALLRPGRFDRLIPVPLPDARGREDILRVHLSKVKVDPDGVDLKYIIHASTGMSGAELANIINESAIIAGKENRDFITTKDLRVALEDMIFGSKRSIVLQEKERKLTAYHEAGHAIVNIFTENSEPIFKATIVPTGKALGSVVTFPEKEEFLVTKAQLLDRICVCLGGRSAEELIFGADYVTSGASSDIRAATDIATRMVTEWGMDNEVGYVKYNTKRHYSEGQIASEETLRKIDHQIRELIDRQYERAKAILTINAVAHQRLAEALLEHETLSGAQIKHIIEHGTLDDYDTAYEVNQEHVYKPNTKKRRSKKSNKDSEHKDDESHDDNTEPESETISAGTPEQET